MRIYYLECLAQATYIISHDGAAFIVDPRRDVDVYIKVCKISIIIGGIYIYTGFSLVYTVHITVLELKLLQGVPFSGSVSSL